MHGEMNSNPVIREINDWLKDNCGVFEDGRPYFRVVFGPSVIHRERCLKEYFIGDTKISEEEVIQRVPKYRIVAPENYLIEKLILRSAAFFAESGEDEVPYEYEPLFVFFADGMSTGFIMPSLRAVQLFMKCLFKGVEESRNRNLEAEQNEKSEDAIRRNMEYLDSQCDYLGHLSDMGQVIHMNSATQKPASDPTIFRG